MRYKMISENHEYFGIASDGVFDWKCLYWFKEPEFTFKLSKKLSNLRKFEKVVCKGK